MAEEVMSPPYPRAGVSATGLFAHLLALREWVASSRDYLNEKVGQAIIPDIGPVTATRQTYDLVGVEIQAQHLFYLCRLREEWDHLVRQYEDAWDCDACIRARAVLVQTAAITLQGAFVPYERREHAGHNDADRLVRMFESVLEVFRDLRQPPKTRGTP